LQLGVADAEGTHVRFCKSAFGALSACALASAIVSASASAQRPAPVSRAAGSAAVVLRVPAPGVYGVRVTITNGPSRRSLAKLRVGSRVSNVGVGGRRNRSQLSLHATIRGRVLAIHVADRYATLHLLIRARRLHALAAGHPHKGSTAGTSASTAGATGSVGSVAAVTPAPAVATAAAPGPAGAAGPPGDPASWHQVFDDEFDGSSLDTSEWSTGWYGSGITAPANSEELECYDPAQVVEGGGELDLNLIAKTESCGGQTRPYASGLISTAGKFSYTYGYAEVRAWLPGTSTINDWPGIWADGQSWPTDGELDVVEGLGGQACWHFHDPQGAPGGCAAGSSYTGGWHTYGADWEPGSVTYYYDGTVVGTITTGITSAPMYLILDLAADNTYGGSLAAPATMRVDYVRVWQHS
jgi:beta-glucanase (GH16 family)